MNQYARTAIFVGVAAVVSLLAYRARPNLSSNSGKPVAEAALFPAFADPLAARSLEIVTYNEESAERKEFKVAQENGVWVIPSHSDYPADAEQQIRDAAGSLTNLKTLGIASELASDHVLFGVVEPTAEKLKNVGYKGGGTLVALQDDKGNDLVRLIVGREVADGSGKPIAGQRFVRKPAEEVVYITKISLDKLPTEFDKWIQKDLLDINTFDISQVNLHDYGVALENRRFAKVPRMDAAITWNNEQSSWTLADLTLHNSGGSFPAPLGEQEELNKQKLDDLKTALDELKIVDVTRKPAGLGSSLKAGEELLKNPEAFQALVEYGFAPTIGPDRKVEILAFSGELSVDMKDGVRYVLRFGKVRASTGTADAKDEVKLNRFLFVTAHLSPVTLVAPPKAPAAPAAPAGPAPAPTEKPAESAQVGRRRRRSGGRRKTQSWRAAEARRAKACGAQARRGEERAHQGRSRQARNAPRRAAEERPRGRSPREGPAGAAAPGERLQRQEEEGPGPRRRAQQPLCRLVLRRLGRRLQEAAPDPRRHRQGRGRRPRRRFRRRCLPQARIRRPQARPAGHS